MKLSITAAIGAALLFTAQVRAQTNVSPAMMCYGMALALATKMMEAETNEEKERGMRFIGYAMDHKARAEKEATLGGRSYQNEVALGSFIATLMDKPLTWQAMAQVYGQTCGDQG